ncbi:MAG: hypothetical protein ABII90_03980 [Bacteroidota bacterium]
MKRIKTTIILSAVVLSSVIGFANVDAAGPFLYVSPASLTKTVGNIFSASVGLNASGSKVFAVEGTLVFNNLSCQSITVADGLMAQSAPTCSNPHFLIGIPNGTTSDKTLVSVSVKAGNAGAASIIPASVDIIGEGVSIGSAATGGNYTINAVPKPTPTTPQTNNGFIGYVNGKIQIFPTREAAQQAGATGIEPNYQRYPAGATPQPSQSPVVTESITPTPSVQSSTQQASILGTIGNVLNLGTGSWLVALIVILAIAYGAYWLIKRRLKK